MERARARTSKTWSTSVIGSNRIYVISFEVFGSSDCVPHGACYDDDDDVDASGKRRS